ncbi:MAG TPA: response regulator [Bacteroidota bacterium]|nr:response regulator [Bacteroidota bacterium]
MKKKRKHILIIDDEPAWRNVLTHFLKHSGYDVRTADSGTEALKTLTRFTPDLILSDVRMPDMNGFDLLDTIKKRIPKLSSTPVVFFSAIDDYDAKKVARDLGAAEFIVKPFNQEEVGTVISRLLP